MKPYPKKVSKVEVEKLKVNIYTDGNFNCNTTYLLQAFTLCVEDPALLRDENTLLKKTLLAIDPEELKRAQIKTTRGVKKQLKI